MINFLRNYHSVFLNNYTILHSPEVGIGFHFIFVNLGYHVFVLILVGVKWYLIVTFICISLMTNDIESCFQVLLGHSCIFFGVMTMQLLCSSFNCLPFCWVVRVFMYFGYQTWFCKYFLPFCRLCFSLSWKYPLILNISSSITYSYLITKLLIMIKPNFFCLVLIFWCHLRIHF